LLRSEVTQEGMNNALMVNLTFTAFKEMLQTPENSPRNKIRKNSEIPLLQPDPRARLDVMHLSVMPTISNSSNTPTTPSATTTLGTSLTASPINETNGGTGGKKDGHKGFMTLGPKHRLRRALEKMNILPKNTIK
jgi:Rap guanine nucleotide exchange factor 2